MKIGITGHQGIIGGAVAQQMSQEGHEVIKLDDYTRACATENWSLDEYPKALEWVLHFGAKTSISESWKDPFSTHANNFNSTLLALKIAHSSKASFIFMSSYVYGPTQYLPINEQHPVRSVNPYMGSKLLGESLCKQFSEQFKIPLVILRGFNIYGNVLIPGRLISDLIESIKLGKSLVLNDPNPKRDYLYIEDFKALILNYLPKAIQNKDI